MSVSCVAAIDLTKVQRDRWRHRCDALTMAPDGARAVVVVGALSPDPEAVRGLRPHVARLRVEVWGEPHAVRRWFNALNAPDDGLGLLALVPLAVVPEPKVCR